MFYWTKNNEKIKGYIFVFLMICAAACDQDKRQPNLYPIDSLVTQQIINLTAAKATLYKVATLSGKRDTIIYTPKDTLGWVSELDIFRQLNSINKPVSRSSYLVDDGLYDPGSNLTVKAFTSLTDLPVRSLRIFYDRSVYQPKKIEAVFNEENALYKSSRLLSLTFQQVNNKTVLTSYSISGGQQIVLGDTVAFSVKGKIQID